MRPLCSLLVGSVLVVAVVACSDGPVPGSSFYNRNIQPIFDGSCTASVSGCHKVNDGDPFAFAAGNLDLTSFENVQLRGDALRSFGAYPVPLLLIKAVGATCELQIPYNDEFLCVDVPHAGGAVFQVGSPAYLTLLQWTENGATMSGLPLAAPPGSGSGSCSDFVPSTFDPQPIIDDPTFGQFRSDVMPSLEGCASATCHGAPASDFFITCGDDDAQLAFNFQQSRAFIADPIDNSELLQRPLPVREGGYGHTGGDFWSSRTASEYEAIAAWGEAVGPITFGEGDPGRTFFAKNIQPLLLSRGCSFEACHSPQAFNDLKLRPGSLAQFSAIALEKNYTEVKRDFMAIEFQHVGTGRAVAKTIFPTEGGIFHRGGALLETPGAGRSVPSDCPPFDPGTSSAFCTFQEWVVVERGELLAAGEVTPLNEGDIVPMIYVDRAATHMASGLEFDTYQPGSDLMRADLTMGPDGTIASVGASTFILGSCPGTRATRDASAPHINVDGRTVVFSMRLAIGEPREIFTVDIDGNGCQQVDPAGFPNDNNGVFVHNFDPVWSPDGEWIVFASSRAGTVSRRLFLPQSDIWRMRADGADPEQMTVLTNSEIQPGLMRLGRLTMSTEKVSDGFYQVSGRRINWDRTDYHPLLGQRSQSVFCDPDDITATCPSVDYAQATEIHEAANGDFLFILSDVGARAGGGTLGVFNRSLGPFETGRSDPGYARSLTIVDPTATGRVGSSTDGAYRSPVSLPDGSILVSYAAFVGDLGRATSVDYDIVATAPCVPPAPGASCTSQRTTLVGGAGQQVEAVLALRRPPHEGYVNRRQLVFGGGIRPDLTGGEDSAVAYIIDAPLIFTLFVANLRRGRPVDDLRSATHFVAYIENPAPSGTTSGTGGKPHYENRVYAGRAPLFSDGSVKVRVPAFTPLVLGLEDDDGNTVVLMGEAHQFAPAEAISMGIVDELFNGVCAGCHGSISGREIEVITTPDVLTGASGSEAREADPVSPQ